MDVDTFKIRLTALPFLSKSDVASYQQRVQQGRVSPETLFREAVRVNKQRKAKEILKKKREFRFMIADIGLQFWDRRSLTRLIDENTVLIRLKARAEKLVKIRERESIGKRRGRLVTFLSGLKLDQADKDKLLERFDGGNSVQVLTQNAIALKKKKNSQAISKDREFLKKSISRIGISQPLQNGIMAKFKPGKEAVRKLIEEAKRLKQNSGKSIINVRRGELSQLANKLNVATNFSKRVAGVDSIEKADALKETIEKAGEKKRVDTIANEKDRLKKIVKEIGIQGAFSGSIAAIKNQLDLNTVKLDIVEASKVVLAKLSNEKNVSSNFSNPISALVFVDRLVPLKKQIEEAGLRVNTNKKQQKFEILSKNKQNFVEFVQKSTLPVNKQQVFINRMTLETVNIPKLREDVATMEKNLKNTQRQKDLNELGAYIKYKNVNKTGLLNTFQTTNVSLVNIKKEVDTLVQKKKNFQAEKNNLAKKANRISLNVNIKNVNSKNNVKTIREKIENAYRKKIQNNKKELSNFALQANINALDDLTKISNLNTLNMAKEMVKQETKNKLYAITASLDVSPILVSKIGSINTIQDVKNVSQEIKTAIHKRNTNMKNANRKQVRQFTNRTRVNLAREQKKINKNKENAYQNEKKLLYEQKQVEIKQLIEQQKIAKNQLIEQQKIETHQKNINKLVEHLTKIGLDTNQQSYFIEQYAVYNKPVNAIKKEANNFYVKLFREYREKSLPKLIENLKKYKLDDSNIEHIVNKYTKTYIEPNVLLNEAKVINTMRTQERWVEVEEEFIDYLDRLTLKPDNRRKITTALEGYFVNFRPLKKSATNMAIKTKNEPRALGRKELVNHINKFPGIGRYNKVQFLKNYNRGVANLNTLKSGAENLKGVKNAEKNIEIREKLNKNATNKLNLEAKNATNKLNLEAKNAANKMNKQTLKNIENKLNQEKKEMKKNQNIYFKRYITNNLGLNTSNDKVQKILNNYNKYPNYIKNHMSEAETLRALTNERIRLTNSAKMLPKDEIRNKRIKNIKNVSDVQQLNSDIVGAYVSMIRKELTNMVLQSGVKANINVGSINSLQKAEETRAKLMNAIERKKNQEYTTVQNAVRNMAPENQTTILQKFTTQNVPLNKMLKRVAELKQQRAIEAYKNRRSQLYNYMNTQLNMNVEDRKTIMNEFNNTGTLENMIKKATNLKNNRIAEKIAADRLKVQKIIEPLELSEANRNLILRNFNTNPGTVLSSETKAKALKTRRDNEKRANERLQLSNHLKSLLLSETNTSKILNIFDRTPEKTLTMSKLNATGVRKQRNRESLTDTMKTLILSDAVKTELLKRFRDKPGDLNTLIAKARQIDAKARKQLDLQKQTRNYVVSLQLGNKDTPILKKVTNMLTPQTAKTIRSEADKVKRELDAETTEKKRVEIKTFMNKTTITAAMKRSFIVTVKLDTDVDALKRKIQAAERTLKEATGQRGRLKAELRTYLNTLDLTNEERKRIEGGVGAQTKSLSALKRQARTISERKQIIRLRRGMLKTTTKMRTLKTESNTRQRTVMRTKAAKAFKKNKNIKDRELLKPRLEKHLYSLPNIPQKRIDEYLTSYMNGKKTIQELTTISNAKNKQFAKTKKRLLTLVPKLPVKNEIKTDLLKKLKTSRMNIDEFKTNTKNLIVRQFIPTKEKKKLIDQLLSLE